MNQTLFYSSCFTAIVICIICYINYDPEYIILYFFTFLGIVTSILNHGYYTNPDKLLEQCCDGSSEIADVIEPASLSSQTEPNGTKGTLTTYYKAFDRLMIAMNTLIYIYFISLLENPLYIIIGSVFICNALFCYFVSKLMEKSPVKTSLHVFAHLFATSLFYFIHIF
jgi:hypothetical protein